MTDPFSPKVREYFDHLDVMIKRDPSDEARLLKVNIDVWERRAAMVDAWAARGGSKRTCPLPPDWTATDITMVRTELARRRSAMQERAAA